MVDVAFERVRVFADRDGVVTLETAVRTWVFKYGIVNVS